MEDLVLKLTENTSIFEVILIIVLGLIFYFRLKDNTRVEINKVETRIDKLETNLNDRIDKLETNLNDRIDRVEDRVDKINMRLDNLYHELFKNKAA